MATQFIPDNMYLNSPKSKALVSVPIPAAAAPEEHSETSIPDMSDDVIGTFLQMHGMPLVCHVQIAFACVSPCLALPIPTLLYFSLLFPLACSELESHIRVDNLQRDPPHKLRNFHQSIL